MKNIDAQSHVQGTSIYVDDIPVQTGTLYAQVFDSPVAHGRIKNLDLSDALVSEGIVRILTHQDITGDNQIGGIIPDEPLLAETEVHFQGQPIALVIATSELAARKAIKKIKVDIDPLPINVCPRKAQAMGHLLVPPRTFQLGDMNTAWEQCAHIFEGDSYSAGQEHLYIETQGAYAYPTEKGGIYVASSTQGPTAVQKTIAKVLGIPMHQVEVDVRRLGGGFGGKEDQATPWAVMVALAAQVLQKPVKYILQRHDDMRMTGKRNPYQSDFKIGLDANYKIIAYQATFYQNGGAAADLSPAILERTLFHTTNSYFIPNVSATAYSCKTNIPPNTAFRGFGGPQAMFVMETAIANAADSLGIDASIIQKRNLLTSGDVFPYGQVVEDSEAGTTWEKAEALYKIDKLQAEITDFNKNNTYLKKGLALMPICFGISFTKTSMNQARALVHVYQDGSVGVSTGAVEMGQGVNTKMLQVAARLFDIRPERIKIETTNTTRVANTSPSAASATADLNGRALAIACKAIRERLLAVAATILKAKDKQVLSLKEERVYVDDEPTQLTWEQLVLEAFLKRVNLSENGHYATPRIHFDTTKEKGHPFAYHVYGTAIIVAKVDCLRGIYTFDSVDIVHDFGKSMNAMIDKGQIEGGLVQGMGWMTMEELSYNEDGRLLSNALSTYKVPDIYSVPKSVQIHFLNTAADNLAIFKSKAVGEPPLMYGIGAYFAVLNAMKAYSPDMSLFFSAPITPEKVLKALYQ